MKRSIYLTQEVLVTDVFKEKGIIGGYAVYGDLNDVPKIAGMFVREIVMVQKEM